MTTEKEQKSVLLKKCSYCGKYREAKDLISSTFWYSRRKERGEFCKDKPCATKSN